MKPSKTWQRYRKIHGKALLSHSTLLRSQATKAWMWRSQPRTYSNTLKNHNTILGSCKVLVYMIPVRRAPPLPPPPPNGSPPPPPCGEVWLWVASLPPLWCGVVWLWVASPLPVVWCGSGVGFGGSPPSRAVAWCGLGSAPCMFGSAWGVW